MAARRKKATRTYDPSVWNLDGSTVDEVCERLKESEQRFLDELSKLASSGWKMADAVRVDIGRGFYDDDLEINLICDLIETDEVYNKRVEKDRKRAKERREKMKKMETEKAAKAEEQEKALLKSLLDKHGIPEE